MLVRAAEMALSEDTHTVLRLDPVPSGEDEIAFEYLSKFWAEGKRISLIVPGQDAPMTGG